MNKLKLDYNLSQNSWFGLGGNAKKFFTPDNAQDLADYLIKNSNEKYYLMQILIIDFLKLQLHK